MRAAAFLSVLLPLAALLAEVAVQTDWSGGPGQSDPCVEWGNSFLDSDSVSYACMGLLQSRAGSRQSPPGANPIASRNARYSSVILRPEKVEWELAEELPAGYYLLVLEACGSTESRGCVRL